MSTHRQVIKTIHDNFYTGVPFAIFEIRDLSGVSTSTIRRVIEFLIELRYVKHNERAAFNKHYRVTSNWPATSAEAIKGFEMAKVMNI